MSVLYPNKYHVEPKTSIEITKVDNQFLKASIDIKNYWLDENIHGLAYSNPGYNRDMQRWNNYTSWHSMIRF